jgi:membrane fusion protein, multidrug efflux system
MAEDQRDSAPHEDRLHEDRPHRDQPQEDRGESAGATQPPDHEEPRRRRVWPLIALGAALILAGIGGTIYWYQTKDEESTEDAYTDGRAITVAAHVPGYVTELAVDDNQFVHQGDLLVQIEPKDYVAARDQAAGELATAQAQLEDAVAALAIARTTFPAQLSLARGRLEQAQGQLFQAQREYRRQHSVDRAATSQQDIDASTANLKTMQGVVDQAEAQLRQAEPVDRQIAEAVARVHELQGQVQQAVGRLAQAEINLGYTRITAPRDGWITMRSVEKGNYLQTGGQLFAIVTPELWITANFKETQLTRIRRGQKVEIEVDAYPDLHLEGHVDSIQLGSGSKFTAFPPENATGNFVKIVQRVPVKILIDKGLDPSRPLPLGISVVPTVRLK